MTDIKKDDVCFGECKDCSHVVDNYGPWHVTKSIYLHENATGHRMRRVGYAEAIRRIRYGHQD